MAATTSKKQAAASVSLTTADILRIHGEELTRGKNQRDARQGTRTMVQAILQAKSPTPYSDQPSLVQAAVQFKRGLSPAEVDVLRAHQIAQVTDADRLASEKARESMDPTHRDAHHYVQKMHQKSLWEEADKLVNAALGVTP